MRAGVRHADAWHERCWTLHRQASTKTPRCMSGPPLRDALAQIAWPNTLPSHCNATQPMSEQQTLGRGAWSPRVPDRVCHLTIRTASRALMPGRGNRGGQAWANRRLATIDRMPSRVIAAFLAFCLFWSGLSTIEAPSSLAQPSLDQHHAIGHAGGPPDLHDGSVEDHHLDDLAAQVQSDPPSDAPGLLPAPMRPAAHFQATAGPPSFVSTAVRSAFLAGPLRPPAS